MLKRARNQICTAYLELATSSLHIFMSIKLFKRFIWFLPQVRVLDSDTRPAINYLNDLGTFT